MKYEKPSLELVEFESNDIVTASLTSNGKGSRSNGDRTIEGEEGTFSGFFEDLLS